MAGLLVATKLHAPKVRPEAIARPELMERLRRGRGAKLTLVSAPAGFGKTTLLAAYLAGDERDGPAAWLSLDHADNEPVTFWSHVVAALQTMDRNWGAALVPILQSGPGSLEPFLAALLNELGEAGADVDLVLDDYHVIDRKEIHDSLAFLLEHLPSNVHLAISTRSDPPLPLARLRARGEMVEIRAADLRFTQEETAAYLNGALSLNLATGEIATLSQRTEGLDRSAAAGRAVDRGAR